MMKNLTILDNIVLPATESKKRKESKADKIKRAEELMRKLSIIDIADNDINEVSGGQLQRACICRSMMNNPRILFADEPTGALNRASAIEVMEELVKLNEEGTAIMLVTKENIDKYPYGVYNQNTPYGYLCVLGKPQKWQKERKNGRT